MNCNDIIEILEKHSPTGFAKEWDNVGLLAGRADKEVHRIMIALDAVDDIVEQAIERKVDMLITHHPLLFRPCSRITNQDFIGRRLIRMIQNDISYYAMHTNFDVMGMAELSAERLKLTNTSVLEPVTKEGEQEEGIGRIGRLPQKMKLADLAEYIKKCLDLKYVIVSGDQELEYECAAISTGSGGSMVAAAIEAGVKVFITGDMDYHMAIDANAQGMAIIDAGHYGTEIMFTDYISEYLKGKCPQLQVMVAVEKNPFSVI